MGKAASLITSRREVIYLALISLHLMLVAPAGAQFNASLNGTVEDSSGAAIPGAKVSLENTATHGTRSLSVVHRASTASVNSDLVSTVSPWKRPISRNQ
jgi:hypothetical protein